MSIAIPYRIFILVFTFLILCACDDDEMTNTGDPSNLVVEVEVADDESGWVYIQAHADNAVEFELRVGSDDEAVETNTTGTFEYQFTDPGVYELDLRAFGSSGRFLRQVIPVTISFGEEEVTPDMGYVTPLSYDGWELVWHDEFDGNTINSDNWVFETGDGCPDLCGWGNNELQFTDNKMPGFTMVS